MDFEPTDEEIEVAKLENVLLGQVLRLLSTDDLRDKIAKWICLILYPHSYWDGLTAQSRIICFEYADHTLSITEAHELKAVEKERQRIATQAEELCAGGTLHDEEGYIVISPKNWQTILKGEGE